MDGVPTFANEVLEPPPSPGAACAPFALSCPAANDPNPRKIVNAKIVFTGPIIRRLALMILPPPQRRPPSAHVHRCQEAAISVAGPSLSAASALQSSKKASPEPPPRPALVQIPLRTLR